MKYSSQPRSVSRSGFEEILPTTRNFKSLHISSSAPPHTKRIRLGTATKEDELVQISSADNAADTSSAGACLPYSPLLYTIQQEKIEEVLTTAFKADYKGNTLSSSSMKRHMGTPPISGMSQKSIDDKKQNAPVISNNSPTEHQLAEVCNNTNDSPAAFLIGNHIKSNLSLTSNISNVDCANDYSRTFSSTDHIETLASNIETDPNQSQDLLEQTPSSTYSENNDLLLTKQKDSNQSKAEEIINTIVHFTQYKSSIMNSEENASALPYCSMREDCNIISDVHQHGNKSKEESEINFESLTRMAIPCDKAFTDATRRGLKQKMSEGRAQNSQHKKPDFSPSMWHDKAFNSIKENQSLTVIDKSISKSVTDPAVSGKNCTDIPCEVGNSIAEKKTYQNNEFDAAICNLDNAKSNLKNVTGKPDINENLSDNLHHTSILPVIVRENMNSLVHPTTMETQKASENELFLSPLDEIKLFSMPTLRKNATQDVFENGAQKQNNNGYSCESYQVCVEPYLGCDEKLSAGGEKITHTGEHILDDDKHFQESVEPSDEFLKLKCNHEHSNELLKCDHEYSDDTLLKCDHDYSDELFESDHEHSDEFLRCDDKCSDEFVKSDDNCSEEFFKCDDVCSDDPLHGTDIKYFDKHSQQCDVKHSSVHLHEFEDRYPDEHFQKSVEICSGEHVQESDDKTSPHSKDEHFEEVSENAESASYKEDPHELDVNIITFSPLLDVDEEKTGLSDIETYSCDNKMGLHLLTPAKANYEKSFENEIKTTGTAQFDLQFQFSSQVDNNAEESDSKTEPNENIKFPAAAQLITEDHLKESDVISVCPNKSNEQDCGWEKINKMTHEKNERSCENDTRLKFAIEEGDLEKQNATNNYNALRSLKESQSGCIKTEKYQDEIPIKSDVQTEDIVPEKKLSSNYRDTFYLTETNKDIPLNHTFHKREYRGIHSHTRDCETNLISLSSFKEGGKEDLPSQKMTRISQVQHDKSFQIPRVATNKMSTLSKVSHDLAQSWSSQILLNNCPHVTDNHMTAVVANNDRNQIVFPTVIESTQMRHHSNSTQPKGMETLNKAESSTLRVSHSHYSISPHKGCAEIDLFSSAGHSDLVNNCATCTNPKSESTFSRCDLNSSKDPQHSLTILNCKISSSPSFTDKSKVIKHHHPTTMSHCIIDTSDHNEDKKSSKSCESSLQSSVDRANITCAYQRQAGYDEAKEQVVPDNTHLPSNFLFDSEQISLNDDLGTHSETPKCQGIKSLPGAYPWTPLFHTTHDSVHADQSTPILSLATISSAKRSIRIGLSKKQKVKRLHKH